MLIRLSDNLGIKAPNWTCKFFAISIILILLIFKRNQYIFHKNYSITNRNSYTEENGKEFFRFEDFKPPKSKPILL